MSAVSSTWYLLQARLLHVVFTSYSCFVRLILIAMASGDQNTTVAAFAAGLLAHVSQQQSSNPSPAGPSNGTTWTNPQNNRWDRVVLWYKFWYWCVKLWVGCALSGVCQCCQLQGGYMHYCFCTCPVFHCHLFWVNKEGFMATLLRVWNLKSMKITTWDRTIDNILACYPEMWTNCNPLQEALCSR